MPDICKSAGSRTRDGRLRHFAIKLFVDVPQGGSPWFNYGIVVLLVTMVAWLIARIFAELSEVSP